MSSNPALVTAPSVPEPEPAPSTSMSAAKPTLGYFSSMRSLLYAMVMTWPLLLIYEVGNSLLNAGKTLKVQNGADAMLESLLTLGGRVTLGQTSLALLVGCIVGVIVELVTERPRLRRAYLVLGFSEAVLLSFLLGPLCIWLMNPTTSLFLLLRFPDFPSFDGLFGNIVGAFGAGFYEELVFRALLVTGLIAVFRLIRVPRISAVLLSTVIGAVIFSAAHHLGSLGDPFTFQVFFFRMAAGVLFNLIYATRGFAIAAWTHALYDVWVMTGMLA